MNPDDEIQEIEIEPLLDVDTVSISSPPLEIEELGVDEEDDDDYEPEELDSTFQDNNQPNPSADISFSLNDLKSVLNVIDVAAERGLFKGEEMQEVGTIRNKLANFIQSSLPTNEQATSPEDVPPSPPDVVEIDPVEMPSNIVV